MTAVTRSSINDVFSEAMREATHRILHPQELTRQDLFRRVLEATREIGIKGARAIEWNPNLIVNWFTLGVVRERRYATNLREGKNRRVDIGYFVEGVGFNRSRYHVRAFHYNPWIFSEERAEKFLRALRRRCLEPQVYHPLSTIFYTDEEIKAWNERRPLYP